jgi:hypothetical protein
MRRLQRSAISNQPTAESWELADAFSNMAARNRPV